ncbi:MAG: NADH-quinone oxidoreductase subunit I [Actinobacteria bacterium]|nr:NADH-quinone oxidoreductase subunit I [Actinomycetota bacterium]
MFGSGMLKGLATTFVHGFRRPVTVQYPEEVLPLPLGYRGRVTLVFDTEKDRYKCTACGLCAKACPVGIIQMTRAKDEKGKPMPYPATWEYNLLECIFCGLCVESCPFGSLTMNPERELAVRGRAQADQDREKMRVDASPEVDAQTARVHGLGQ